MKRYATALFFCTLALSSQLAHADIIDDAIGNIQQAINDAYNPGSSRSDDDDGRYDDGRYDDGSYPTSCWKKINGEGITSSNITIASASLTTAVASWMNASASLIAIVASWRATSAVSTTITDFPLP